MEHKTLLRTNPQGACALIHALVIVNLACLVVASRSCEAAEQPSVWNATELKPDPNVLAF